MGCRSAWGPDADRHVKRLIPGTEEGSLSEAGSHPGGLNCFVWGNGTVQIRAEDRNPVNTAGVPPWVEVRALWNARLLPARSAVVGPLSIDGDVDRNRVRDLAIEVDCVVASVDRDEQRVTPDGLGLPLPKAGLPPAGDWIDRDHVHRREVDRATSPYVAVERACGYPAGPDQPVRRARRAGYA
jgi:hypothetical protein